jgi:hypothetical protein
MSLESRRILHANGNYWVGPTASSYTVWHDGLNYATADSSYPKTPDGLSIAKARCDYKAKKEQ